MKSEIKNTNNTRMTLVSVGTSQLETRISIYTYLMFTAGFALHTPHLHIMEQQTTKPSGKVGVNDLKRQPGR